MGGYIKTHYSTIKDIKQIDNHHSHFFNLKFDFESEKLNLN
jgi:hypothetical protein